MSSFSLALTLLATLIATHDAAAQSLRCTPIRPGDTVTRVAVRLTGDAGSTRESWFQIVDPVTSRVVPKARYDYVRAGWTACVVSEPGPAVVDANVALWAMLLALIALATHGADDYFTNRKKVVTAMQQFAEKFVREFERPLVRPDTAGPPIQSRFRFTPSAGRLDILIAPGAGRRYPNLTDHRSNVEYDLERVLHVLRDQPFINGPPYMNGTWVVLPFQWKLRVTQAGAA